MIMMYNDTYAAMTRSKHPHIFAKPILCPETMQKVIAERRLMTLRTMGERAKLCKNVGQLTEALLSVLDQQKEEYASHLTLPPHFL